MSASRAVRALVAASETASHDASEAGLRRTEALAWVALALLAVLRFAGLSRFGLWIDEALTLNDAAALAHGAQHDFPFGLAATWTAVQAFGDDSEWALRFAPALFGALGLVVCVWAFEPAVGRARALAIALLIGLSSWHLFWSQSARAYTLAFDMSLLGGGLVVRALKRGGVVRFVLGLAMSALAGLAHPSAALVAPALGCASYLADPRRRVFAWRPPPAALSIALALALAALAGWGADVWQTYFERKAGGNTLHFVLTCGWYFTPLVAASALCGAFLALRPERAFERLALWTCAFVASVAVAASLRAVLSAQYVFALLPWVALLATAPLFEQRWPRALRTTFAALLLAVGIADVALYFTLRHGDRPRWNDAYAWVYEQRGDDDLVFGMAWPSGAFYLQPGDTNLRVPTALARLSAFHATALEQWPRRDRRMWFVVNHEDLLAWNSEDRVRLERWLAEQTTKARSFEVAATPRHLTVDVYVRD